MKLFLIILNISLVISAFFTTKFPTNDQFNQLSSLFIVIFAIPSIVALYKTTGKLKSFLIFLGLGLFAVSFEYFSIKTGYPYGPFVYTSNVGLKILDTVPWAIGFAWVPMVLASYLLARSSGVINKYKLIILAAIILVLADFVLDPGAVALNMWVWQDKSFLYDVPLSNYFGWFISGTIGSFLIYLFSRKTNIFETKYNNWYYLSFYIIVGFWTYVDMFKSLWLAFLTGLILLFGLSLKMLKNSYKKSE